MGIFVDWGDADETLWICRFSGNWTADDFMTAFAATQNAVSDKSVPVDMLVDLRQAHTTPQNLIALLRKGAQFVYEHRGLIVVITQNDFWKRMHNLIIHTFFRGTPTGIHFVKTVDDAYYFLDIKQEERHQAKPNK
jgi:hypothetical protein